ncbi:hypothetical protein D6D25_00891 [Aureobasidium pullulans]|nr:hypothetical protein D6D25_00891 [Aureobasidium pullulans]
MADPPRKESDTIMARAVLLPITNFNPGTPRLDGREARLKAMISNSDAHDREVRNRMFSATFAPDAIEANKTRPEITEQTTPEVLAASDSLRRCKEYNTRAAQQRQFLNETLRKYDGSAASSPATTAGARRESTGMAPVAPMGAPAAVMEGSKEHDGLRSGEVIQRVQQNLKVPGEAVLEAFEHVIEFFEPMAIMLRLSSLGLSKIWIACGKASR